MLTQEVQPDFIGLCLLLSGIAWMNNCYASACGAK